MKRLLLCGVILLGALALADDAEAPKSAKEALQTMNDFIGSWKGSGGPEARARPGAGETWSETVSWEWRFKGDDAWLVMHVRNGRHVKGGELRYLPDKRRYQLTVTDPKKKKAIFEGEWKKDYLTFERVDPATKETQRLTLNLAGDGARLVYRYATKPEGRTIFSRGYLVACTKEGESLGKKEKKIECVVSGGLGTMAVSYKGVTYYVCCSGCRDAFNENPEKYIKEFEMRKAGKQ